MRNNQEILRKHTALSVSRKDVNTSFIMFPVRLETRFVEGKRVDDISEPDRALFAYKAIWNYVRSLNSPSSLPSQAKHVLDAVENLDTVYREDKTRLRKICTAIASRTAPNGSLKEMWDRVLVHLDRLATLDIVHDNEATDFLEKLDKVDRILKQMRTKPRFSGAARFKAGSAYSQTAVFKNARKEMQACLPVLEQFLPDNPEQSIVNRFTIITKNQFKKFQRVVAFLKYSQADYLAPLERIGIRIISRRKTLQQRDKIMQGFKKDLAQYEKYRSRYFGGKDSAGKKIPARRQSLTDKMRSKMGDYCHYTRFAERMILWQLWLQTGRRKDIANAYLAGKWRALAEKTVFSFHEEREWLVSVLKAYNDYERKKAPYCVISPAHLNRHNRYIRPRSLQYRVRKDKCLLVRIFPDEIAVTLLSRPLTPDEVTHAREFWLRYFAVGEDELKRKAAWEALCSVHTAPRAALIARSVFPKDTDRSNQLATMCLQHAAAIQEGTLSEESAKRLQAFFEPEQGTVRPEELFPVPMSELMPDRFILQAKLDNGGKKDITIVRYGRLIPKSIQVGLDFNSEDSVNVADKGLRFEGNLRWMTDYDAAERMGMAITLPLDEFRYEHHTLKQKHQMKKQGRKVAEPRTFHFNSIYVMGMKEFDADNVADSDACSRLLAKVFNAHLYSDDGLDLLKVGTPTNILDDADLESSKAGHAALSSNYDTGTDAQVEDFYRKSIKPLPGGIQMWRKSGDAALLTELFRFESLPAEENPFLNVAGRGNREIQKAKLVRRAFLKVLAGSHPLLKVIDDSPRLKMIFEKQVSPIGVYPSIRIGSQPYGIVPVCDFKNLKYGREDALSKLKDILLLLTEKWNAIASASVISEENMNASSALTTEERYVKAVSATPISTSFYARSAVREQDVLTPGYFKGWKDGVDPVQDIFDIIHTKVPLLNKEGFIKKYIPSYPNLPLRDAVFAEFKDKFTWGNLLASIRQELKSNTAFKGVTDSEIEDLITATFDLFNYRLDAWLTGLLNHRINQRINNSTKAHKIALGAYGFVFNLWEDKGEPVSEEYVVAPSINQAITAAVLRSSFNRAAEGNQKDYSMSVNLSSARVRQALRIIHGIQNGLSLGTILGSDLERLLHDDRNRGGLEMDFFIYYLRVAYPLNDTTTTYGTGDKESSIDVLNGVALLEDLRGRVKDIPGSEKLPLTRLYADHAAKFEGWLKELFQQNSLQGVKSLFRPGEYESKIPRLFFLMQEMEDSYDALSDVVTAESVFKLTEGNTAAVDALMNSLQNGRSIPVPDVTEIPVRSAHIEQRVVAALDAGVEESDGDSFMQMAEPAVDKWMGDMLGFSRIGFGGKELGLSPSELVYLSGDWGKFEHFLELFRFIDPGKDVQGECIPLDEAKMAVDSMRELLSRARPLRQDDLVTGAVTPDKQMEVTSLCAERYARVSEKVSNFYHQLNKLGDQLEKDCLSAPYQPMSEGRLKEVLNLLLKCFRLGLLDALSGFDLSLFVQEERRYEHPTEFADILSRQQKLPALLHSLADIVYERLSNADSRAKESAPDALKGLFGSYFIAVPRIRLEGNETLDVESMVEQYNTPGYFRNAGRLVLEGNLMELADVRKPLSALHQVRLYGKFNSIEAVRDICPMQLGYKTENENERHYWMGAEVPTENLVKDASVFTVLKTDGFLRRENGKPLPDIAALMLDFWVEKIPYRDQTAGVVFGYDQPDAEPPQAVLVGVSTIGGKHMWSERRMLRTIRSAMHQIQSRAVEPEHVYAHPWTSGLFPLLDIDPDNPTK